MTEATRIDAGRVVIAGGARLSDWSTDGATFIEGGKICTQTALPSTVASMGFGVSREEAALERRVCTLEDEVLRLRRIIDDGRRH